MQKRLQALQEAQAVYEALVEATYDVDQAVPNERLALFDRRWFSRGETGPFISPPGAPGWVVEQEIESEAVTLCQDVLGIEVGDIVVVEAGKNLV